jgi:methionyl-tRNA formyltransferase
MMVSKMTILLSSSGYVVHAFSAPRCHHFAGNKLSVGSVSTVLNHLTTSLRLPRQHHCNEPLVVSYHRHERCSSGRSSRGLHCPSSRLFSSATTSDSTTDIRDGKKRVVFLGTPEVASSTLRKLYEDSCKSDAVGGNTIPYEIVCVITQPPKRRRRKGDKEEPTPVGIVAEELGLPVLAPEKANDSEFLDRISHDVRPDLCITAAYGQYLPKRFLATPTLGTVNIHPSLLPKWRGASPVQRSLEAGDNPVGVTVLYTVSKMDAGPIIAQQDVMVDENDVSAKVLPWLFDIGTDLLIKKLPDLLSGKITMETAQIQDESQAVAATMIDSSEGELKPWKESATTMHNKRRGFSMWPGAYLYLQVGEGTEPTKYKILETRVVLNQDKPVKEVTDSVQPGPTRKDGVRLVGCDGSILEIMKLQPATKKPVDALSFVNGLQGRTVRYVRTPEGALASQA